MQSALTAYRAFALTPSFTSLQKYRHTLHPNRGLGLMQCAPIACRAFVLKSRFNSLHKYSHTNYFQALVGGSLTGQWRKMSRLVWSRAPPPPPPPPPLLKLVTGRPALGLVVRWPSSLNSFTSTTTPFPRPASFKRARAITIPTPTGPTQPRTPLRITASDAPSGIPEGTLRRRIALITQEEEEGSQCLGGTPLEYRSPRI